MPQATKPSRSQRRKAKENAAKQNEVPSIPAVREYHPHQLPQADTAQETVSIVELEEDTKVERVDLIETKHNKTLEVVHSVEEADPVQHATTTPDSKKARLAMTVTAYLLGLLTLFAGILILFDQKILAEYLIPPVSETGVLQARQSQAVRLVNLSVGRNGIAKGLTILSLVYWKHLRALGMLLLCEVAAAVLTTVVAWNFGLETDNLPRVTVAAVKTVLGWWMLRCE